MLTEESAENPDVPAEREAGELTPKELGAACHPPVTGKTIRNQINAGKLRARQTASGWLIAAADAEAWIAATKIAGTPLGAAERDLAAAQLRYLTAQAALDEINQTRDLIEARLKTLEREHAASAKSRALAAEAAATRERQRLVDLALGKEVAS